jgi:hypothetical protein
MITASLLTCWMKYLYRIQDWEGVVNSSSLARFVTDEFIHYEGPRCQRKMKWTTFYQDLFLITHALV